MPCFVFLYANYHSGINLCKKAEKGDTIYASILADLDLALQQLTKTERYIFTMEVIYDVRMYKKDILVIAKNKIEKFLCTPDDLIERLKEI